MKNAKGRNRYAKKCAECGKTVEAFQGYLGKNGKGGWLVRHPGCKPGASQEAPQEPQEQFSDKDDILSILEAKLVQRHLNGEPVILLPKIIEEIKGLREKLSKKSDSSSKKSGYYHSITGEMTCKNCGNVTNPLD